MATREYDIIDGVWSVSVVPPTRGSKRYAYWQYAITQLGLNAVFHKRSLVRELFALAQLTGPCKMFTEEECLTDKNIHARLDRMKDKGYFSVIEDYSIETLPS